MTARTEANCNVFGSLEFDSLLSVLMTGIEVCSGRLPLSCEG